MTALLAHAGHWTTAVVYLAPMLIVAAYQGVAALRGRRRHRDGQT